MKKTALFFLLLSLLHTMVFISPAHAINWGDIVTVAGGGVGDNNPATSIGVSSASIILDSVGNLYIADYANGLIRKVDAVTGIITTVADCGYPNGIAIDSAGNFYVSSGNNIIKVNAATGTISTVSGNGKSGFSGDNITATSTSLSSPAGISVDSAGNLYIADKYNDRIRKVDSVTGIITTVAGNGTSGFGSDNVAATATSLNGPSDVSVDSAGNLYIADTDNHRIRRVDAVSGIITTVAGNGIYGFSGDNVAATTTRLNYPRSITLDSVGNLYIADTANHRIRKVDAVTGIITTVAGYGTPGYPTMYVGDGGPATDARLYSPSDVRVDSFGNIYINDYGDNLIRKVDAATGIITTVAGNGTVYYGDNALATKAKISSPNGISVDSAGNLYVADTGNIRIRKVDAATGVITTVAGGGGATMAYHFGDDGAATSARVFPYGVSLDSAGNIYIADATYNRIRKVDASTGIITSVAGDPNYNSGYSGDNVAATATKLNAPNGVTVDSAGNIYIADTGNHRIRKVNASTGIITTVAGSISVGFSGDNTAATAASLNGPSGVSVDSIGNIYIADTYNHRIRKIDAFTGIITTVAGNSEQCVSDICIGGYSGDNVAATATKLNYPNGVTVDNAGNIYIADTGNHRIRKVNASTGIITTVAGSISVGFSGDNGPANAASLNAPTSVSLDSSGNLYIADANNNRIRKVYLKAEQAVPINGACGNNNGQTLSLAPTTSLCTAGAATLVTGTGPWNWTCQGLYGGTSASCSAAIQTLNITFASSGNGSLSGATSQTVKYGAATTAVTAVPAIGYHFVNWNGTNGFTTTAANPLTVTSVTSSMAITANFAQDPDITTIAGGGVLSGDNGLATAATLHYPSGVSMDSAGNIYIADVYNYRIRKVDAITGIITTVAGNGMRGFSGDNGPAIAASINVPRGVSVDTVGNIYFADTENNRIRRVDPATGIITTVAGDGTIWDGTVDDNVPATSATFDWPTGVTIDSAGNLYIAELGSNRIRKVNTATGIITTVAGNREGYSGDNGPATEASLDDSMGVSLDSAGNLYIADARNNRIRKINAATGIITTVAGNGDSGYSGDNGPALAASLNYPSSVSVDKFGNIYIADMLNNRIRKVSAATGIITTMAGNGESGYSGDNGPALAASLNYPGSVSVDTFGNIYLADMANNRIRKVSAATGVITTVAGDGTWGLIGDDGVATAARLNFPTGVIIDSTGNIYIADQVTNRIRKVDVATGIITTVAGNGESGYSGDNGPAPAASLNGPQGVSTDGAGNLYIADTWNGRIRKVDAATGIITSVAGNGESGYTGDNGPALAASLSEPQGVSVDSAGNLYIADYWNHRIRKVNAATGIITTVAGCNAAGFTGDNGPATTSNLYNPRKVFIDSQDNLYIADSGNNRIRRVDAATGIITTVAGNGQSGYSGDNGPALAAKLNEPVSVSMDGAGNIYIVDSGNNRIRKVDTATGIITTVAGNGTWGFSGDNGPATAASLGTPSDISVNSAGNLYIADSGTNRIRKVNMNPEQTVSINGACGNNNGQTLSLAPTTSLCTEGAATPVTGTGPWNWTCQGLNGGTSASCSAAIQTLNITFASGGNGTLTGATSQTVKYGAATTAVTAVPAAGYHFVNWTGTNGFATTTANPLSVTGVTSSMAITANFAQNTQNLNVTVSGAGTVNSTPSGIACQTGIAAGCTAQFTPGTPVTLLPTPSANATFTGWSGACSGSGGCSVTMNSAKSVTATFTPNPAMVKVTGNSTPFYAIDPALDAVTLPGTVVSARDQIFVENLIMTNPVAIRLLGGYTDAGFTTRTGTSSTTIDGSLKVRGGTLRVERISVR